MENDKLIMDYLIKNYSPKRIRTEHKFKLTYFFNGMPFYFSNKSDMLNLAVNLNKTISVVFHLDKNSNQETINKFLRIF